MEEYDYILIGAGFFCSVLAERIANDLNKKVLIIDKRNHIGGNCYSEIDTKTGIEYHKYGTHIFHTSNKLVWDYLNKFTSFNSYRHQVLTTFNDNIYQLPINLETINAFFKVNLKPYEVDTFLKQQEGVGEFHSPSNFEEQAINTIGRALYEAFIKGYTIKQWGKDPKELPTSIFKRLPFRKNYDESYYFDTYQGIPTDGYTAIFKKLLSSKNITLKLNTDFSDIGTSLLDKATIIYSGAIDRLFDYKYGKLAYRSLRFEKKTKAYNDFQGTSVMNFANSDITHTRIHEPKHLHPEREYPQEETLIITEYSIEATQTEPYYPIGGNDSNALYKKYLQEVKETYPNMIVGGRLGDYKYYDMHHVIENAINTYHNKIKN